MGRIGGAARDGFGPCNSGHLYARKRSIFDRPFAQQDVAVARFLKAIVAGKTPASVPRLEHDEFNRVQGIPDLPMKR